MVHWGEGQLTSLAIYSDSLRCPPPLLTLVCSLRRAYFADRRWKMTKLLWNLLREDEAQDIAEYAVMLAVILVIVVGTIRLIGSNANTVFSSTASAIQ